MSYYVFDDPTPGRPPVLPPARDDNGNGNGNSNARQTIYAERTSLAFNAATLIGSFGAAIIGAVLVTAWLAGREEKLIDSVREVHDVARDIGRSVDRLSERQDRFEAEVRARTADRYTKSDQRIFCYQLERENAGIGIKCPEF